MLDNILREDDVGQNIFFTTSGSGQVSAAINDEILRADEGEVKWIWSNDGMQGLGQWYIPEKTRRDPTGKRTRFALVRGGCSSHYDNAARIYNLGCGYYSVVMLKWEASLTPPPPQKNKHPSFDIGNPTTKLVQLHGRAITGMEERSESGQWLNRTVADAKWSSDACEVQLIDRCTQNFLMSVLQDIPDKTRQPAASSGTISTYENPVATPPEIKPGSPWWEASSLTTTTTRPRFSSAGGDLGGFLTRARFSWGSPVPFARAFQRCFMSTHPNLSPVLY
ncbi:hypothetical protein PR048_032069 [Dryococelus australis]|uniref:Uncharacterized protein n=1 Tax=Dryococelus australis TaxID=614101 RepID=A0ABQ9G168_9NEOP|nr:hypothetical protein PR048_032069 [Dryococelus australis]